LGDLVGDSFGGAAGSGDTLDKIKRAVRDAVIGGIASVAGGGKFKNGAITAAFARLYNDELANRRGTSRTNASERRKLVFDGDSLDIVDGLDNVVATFPAASGVDEYQHYVFQGVQDLGPIPEGTYVARQGALQSSGGRPMIDRALGAIGRGKWPGGYRSCGSGRIWLTPAIGTDTLSRSGFSIHGGTDYGSQGCIDLARQFSAFAKQFQAYGRDMILEVKYVP